MIKGVQVEAFKMNIQIGDARWLGQPIRFVLKAIEASRRITLENQASALVQANVWHVVQVSHFIEIHGEHRFAVDARKYFEKALLVVIQVKLVWRRAEQYHFTVATSILIQNPKRKSGLEAKVKEHILIVALMCLAHQLMFVNKHELFQLDVEETRWDELQLVRVHLH